ncbi:MAG: tetratricopeptide repeat protein [Salinivirgaceae bacterium]|nr:tetratricopeptide repeat protein [Salinivirgaceae bacterium]
MKNLFTLALLAFAMTVQAQDFDVVEATNSGNEAYRNKDYKKAYELYTQVLADNEKNGKELDKNINYNAAYCAAKAKMNDEAIALFRKSIEADYKVDKSYQQLGKIQMDTKDVDGAIETLNAGLGKFPDDASMKKLIGSCYQKKAMPLYNEANSIKKAANESGMNTSDPDKFKAEYAKADAKFQEALPLFEKAYEYDPTNKNVVKGLQNIYTTLDMPEKAASLNVAE